MTSRAEIVILVAIVVVGIAMRIAILAGDSGVIDADEAVVGLAALDAWDGELATFFPGQDFGGALETWLVAPVVGVAGPSRVSLKIVPMMLCALGLVAVWRSGAALLGRRSGRLAAALCWIWPAVMVWWSTKARGFYWVGFVAAWSVVALSLRLAAGAGAGWLRLVPATQWVGLGLAVGIGWWTTPLTMVVIVPTLGWLAWQRFRGVRGVGGVRDVRGIGLAALGALAGAAFWLRANSKSSFASLSAANVADGDGYLGHLRELVTDALPTSLGLRNAYSGHWWAGPLGPVVYVALVCALVAASVLLWRRATLLVVIGAAGPLIGALNPAGVATGDARYLLFLWPVWALLLVGLVGAFTSRPSAFAALVVAALAITAGGWGALDRNVHPRVAPSVTTPVDLGPTIDTLESEGVRYAWAHYWISYRLGFESDGSVVATPRDVVRFPEMLEAVRRADRVAFVVVTGSSDDEALDAAFACLGEPFVRVPAGQTAVYVPDSAVSPEQVDTACSNT